MRRFRGGCALVALCLLPCASAAEDLGALSREALRAVLLETGRNTREAERHAVEVEGCEMTTFWWRKHDSGDWVLWSSFRFDMGLAMLQENSAETGSYVMMAVENAREAEDLALFFFNMRAGSAARHEKPFVRHAPDPKREVTPAPRGTGESHYYQPVSRFFIRHEGAQIGPRARRFGAAYVDYARRFCTLSG